MAKLTVEEIATFRSRLTDYPDALMVLDTIEDCEGDLEDAAIVLAIRAGQEPDTANSRWLDDLARQCRGAVCKAEFRADLQNGLAGAAIGHLATTLLCPPLLSTLVVLYVLKQDIDQFCGTEF